MNENRLMVWVFAAGVLVAGCAIEDDFGNSPPPGTNDRTVAYSPERPASDAKLPDLGSTAELPDLLTYAALNNAFKLAGLQRG